MSGMELEFKGFVTGPLIKGNLTAGATKYFPKFFKAWFRAGVALEKLGQLRAAGQFYYHVMELDENSYAKVMPSLARCRNQNIANRKESERLLAAPFALRRARAGDASACSVVQLGTLPPLLSPLC